MKAVFGEHEISYGRKSINNILDRTASQKALEPETNQGSQHRGRIMGGWRIGKDSA